MSAALISDELDPLVIMLSCMGAETLRLKFGTGRRGESLSLVAEVLDDGEIVITNKKTGTRARMSDAQERLELVNECRAGLAGLQIMWRELLAEAFGTAASPVT